MKTPLHWTGKPPTTPPKLRLRDPNKPPAFQNSAPRRHPQAGRVRDPSRYVSLQCASLGCKLAIITLHFKCIPTSSKTLNLPMSSAKAVHVHWFYQLLKGVHQHSGSSIKNCRHTGTARRHCADGRWAYRDHADLPHGPSGNYLFVESIQYWSILLISNKNKQNA